MLYKRFINYQCITTVLYTLILINLIILHKNICIIYIKCNINEENEFLSLIIFIFRLKRWTKKINDTEVKYLLYDKFNFFVTTRK